LKSFFLNILFLLGIAKGHSQHELCGYVIEMKTKTAIPYTTVFNKTKNMGVYTDSRGYFSLPASLNDNLYFSNIGYESLNLTRHTANNCDTVYLTATIHQLPMVEVSDFFWLKNKSFELGDLNQHQNYVNWIIPGVTLIKYFYNPEPEGKCIIGSIKIRVSQNTDLYEPRLARVHLYKAEANGEIGSSLMAEDEIFTIEKPNSEIVSFDLNKYKIRAPYFGFYGGLEIIGFKNEKNRNKGAFGIIGNLNKESEVGRSFVKYFLPDFRENIVLATHKKINPFISTVLYEINKE